MRMIFIMCFALNVSAVAFGNGKHPSTPAFANVIRVLNLYKIDNEGRLPKDWREFVNSGYLSGSILDDARKYCDIENRFQFIDPPILIRVSGENLAIVVMENESENSDSQEQSQRWLAVQNRNGSLGTRRYTETALARLFQEAGSDLSLYTKESPPPPVIRVQEHRDSDRMVIGPTRDSVVKGIQRRIRSLNPFSQEKSPSSGTADSGISWLLWYAIIAMGGLSIISGFIIFRKNKKSCRNK